MDGIQKTGDQVDRPIQAETAHILRNEARFRATYRGAVEHRLVDVEATAGKSGIDEVAHVRPGPAGEVQVAPATVAEQLLQALDAVALCAVIDIGAHQIVITREVGIERIAGHGGLLIEREH